MLQYNIDVKLLADLYMQLGGLPTAVIVCDSSGKDSTVLTALAAEAFKHICPVIVHHQVLPEAWAGTEEYVQKTANRYGLEVVFEQALYYGYECDLCHNRWTSSTLGMTRCGGRSKRNSCGSNQSTMIMEIRGLVDLMNWRGMWPSSAQRWCTSYLKRDLFDKWLRENRKRLGARPVMLMGERRLESSGRKKLPFLETRNSLPWLTIFRPLLDFKRIEIFRALRERHIEPHECYSLQGMSYQDMYETDEEGGPRDSCVCCIYLKEENVADNLALPQNQELLFSLVETEDRTKFLFKEGLSIEQAVTGRHPGLQIRRTHYVTD